MAYVAISNNLISATQNNIMKMRDKEKATVKEPPERITVPSDDANLELMVWGTNLHLREQLPDDWKTTVSRINIRIPFTWAPEKTSTTTFIMETRDPFEVPHCKGHSYYGYDITIAESSLLLPAAARESVEFQKFCRQTDTKWDDVKTQVTEFLRAAKSLNEALKLWPALSLYVSDEYMDRVNNNPKREKAASRAEEVMATISIDHLTAAAVASKLTV